MTGKKRNVAWAQSGNSVMKGLTPDAYAPDEYMLKQYWNIM